MKAFVSTIDIRPHGGFGDVGGSVASAYGDLLDPNDPGGGGGSNGGVGGNCGGVVRINAANIILDELILTNGGVGGGGTFSCCAGGGAGGGIRVDVGTLSGLGSIRANGGGVADARFSGGGGGGRVAIYHTDATGFNLFQVLASGGSGLNSGGTGTVSLVLVP